MHATLRSQAAHHGEPESAATGPGLASLSAHRAPAGSTRQPKGGRWTRSLLPALAASLALVSVGFVAGTLWRAPETPPLVANHSDAAADEPAIGEAREIARVTGIVDCKWQEDGKPFSFGEPIASGQSVRLIEGLVQLTFGHGAKVIVQGPAQFEPRSATEAALHYGKIAALVPEQARGYTVTTPTAEVVDLGTEFGLEVGEDGATEVHVINGDVVARRRLPDGELRGEAVHVRKLNALRFTSSEDDASLISAEPDKFARQIVPQLASDQLPSLPIVRDLKFWVAADLLVSRTADNRVTAWRDVCVGDNQIGNDACQFMAAAQPRWAADPDNGAPAIWFDGEATFLTTDAFATGDQVTIFVAFRPSHERQNNTYHGGHLLNFGGQAPTIELDIAHDDTLRCGLWAANAVGVGIKVGNLKRPKVQRGKPCVLSYHYNRADEQAELFVDGQSQGRTSAPLSPKVFSPRTIGAHGRPDDCNGFYRGGIYEVLIYDSVLDPSDHEQVTDYLASRYLGVVSGGGQD